MRRLSDDRGTAAIIVALLSVVLFGMGAFVVDVAALVQERRVLQNGADASALAIAEECGGGDCGDPEATAEQYSDANADDSVTAVEELCGRLVTGVAECSDPPDVPDGAGYVRVTTKTERTDGTDQVRFSFARFLGFDGLTVHSRAIAAWGGPAAIDAELPLTISQCEYNAYTDSGDALKDPPPYDTSGYPTPEAIIYLHDTTEANPCAADESSSGADLPGGFGWLDTNDDCETTSESGDWYHVGPGASPNPNDCKASYIKSLIGTIVHIPIFDRTNGETGANGEYHVAYFASFYLTGYSLEGQYTERSVVTNTYCNDTANGQGTTDCISGFFVNDPTPVSGTIGGPSAGVVVVQLIG
jgi:hypothetical protein